MAELAERQHGVVARRQLVALGITANVVDWWVRTGRLHVIHHGVYAVGDRALPRLGPVMAAVLAAGPGAVVSHRSAAWLWNLRPDSRAVVDVTVAGRRRGRRGIAIHEARSLDPRDRTEVDAIPVTSVTRTLLDFATAADPGELKRALDEAERARLFDLVSVRDVMARSRGHHGLKPLGEGLRDLTGPGPVTRSELEARFTAEIAAAGLPPPSQNVLLHGYEVDALWEDAQLVVELDGYAYHHTRSAFESDRRRDADLQLAGYRVIRVTHRMLAWETTRTMEMLRTLTQP